MDCWGLWWAWVVPIAPEVIVLLWLVFGPCLHWGGVLFLRIQYLTLLERYSRLMGDGCSISRYTLQSLPSHGCLLRYFGSLGLRTLRYRRCIARRNRWCQWVPSWHLLGDNVYLAQEIVYFLISWLCLLRGSFEIRLLLHEPLWLWFLTVFIQFSLLKGNHIAIAG